MRRRLVQLGIVLVVAVIALGGWLQRHNNATAAAPSTAAVGRAARPGSPYFHRVEVGATRKEHGVCSAAPLPPAKETRTPVYVDPRPLGATAVWSPGLNSATCRTLTTHLTKTQSQALAREVDTDTVIPDGATFSCPSDDGARVDLYFAYAGRPSELISIPLSGCRFVSAPGRGARYAPAWTGGTTVLDAVTPHGWVRQNVGS